MRNVKLLDCTLRDGGYINDWKFGERNMIEILTSLGNAGVDYIEVGFLSDEFGADRDRALFRPDTDQPDSSLGYLLSHADCKHAAIVGMIDFATYSIKQMPQASDSVLDGIRLMFRKNAAHDVADFIGELKALGYKVFLQPVSITSYRVGELKGLAELANRGEVDALYIVDTYGLLRGNDLVDIFKRLDCELDGDIAIGYHGHNNMQTGHANCVALMRMEGNRELRLDGSLYGMGKTAGNPPTELIALSMNEILGKHYDIPFLVEGIENSILKIKGRSLWGYDLYYFVAAFCKSHPKYIEYFRNEGLGIRAVIDAANEIPDDLRLTFSKEAALNALRSSLGNETKSS